MQQQQLRYYQGLAASGSPGSSSDPLSRLHLPPSGHRPTDLLSGQASPASRSSLLSRRPFDPNKEPETITVSDDDDEEPSPKANSSSTSKAAKEETKFQAVDLAKPSAKPPKSPTRAKTPEEKNATTVSAEVPSSKVQDEQFSSVNIKQEPSDDAVEDVDMKLIAESLLSLSDGYDSKLLPAPLPYAATSSSSEDTKENMVDGFDMLLRGIELHQQSKDGIDMLCAVTHEEASTQVSYDSSHFLLSSRLDVLCCVTNRDKLEIEEYIDPLILLKQQFNLRQHYTSPEAIQSFIQTKTQYYKRLEAGQEFEQDPDICPSLAKIIKKIKNTEFMSDLEIELRNKLLQLQEDYREKQSQLSRFKSPKKRLQKKKSRGGKVRKTPKKLTPKRRNSLSPALSKVSEGSSPIRAPPRLEPPSSPPRLQSNAAESWKQSTALLKPPKLTASLAPLRKSSVTNLSTINARFMKGKANPFANLLSKLTSASTSGTTSPVKQQMPDIDEEGEDENENDIETATNTNDDEGTTGSKEEESETESDSDDEEEEEEDEYTFNVKKAQYGSKRGRSSSVDDASSSKKRKADKPKKQSGTTETIVPKKPKNLFMMNCYEFESGFMSQEEKEISATASPSKKTQSPVKVKKLSKVSYYLFKY